MLALLFVDETSIVVALMKPSDRDTSLFLPMLPEAPLIWYICCDKQGQRPARQPLRRPVKNADIADDDDVFEAAGVEGATGWMGMSSLRPTNTDAK